MYALLIGIHGVFVLISHILSYRLFEGVFLLFGCFFLFYFSPLFFLDKDEKDPGTTISWKNIFSQFSLENSFIVPITLFYIGLYLLLYSIFGSKEGILFLHATIIISLYSIFLGYGLLFYWKHDTFFEALRFHTLFTLTGSIGIVFFTIVTSGELQWLHVLLLTLGILSALFLLLFTPQEANIFIIVFLLSILSTAFVSISLILPVMSIQTLLSLSLFFSFVFFDIFPRIPLFEKYNTIIRYFSLLICFFSITGITFFLFSQVSTLGVISLSLALIFLLSIHIRFTNYIAYGISLFLTFFLYALLFSGLLDPSTPVSLFLFIFFLPILLLGTTYVIEEAHPYDFIILHYSSILFSLMYSIYAVFFIGWGSDLFFILSFTFFGTAFLLFLSYFRFRKTS